MDAQPTATQTDAVSSLYEPHVLEARAAFHSSRVVEVITSSTTNPKLLDRFLIQFSALGLRVTEPVEGWIARAGQRTIEIGHRELGEALVGHATHEKDHHLMRIDDTNNLVELWNHLGRDKLDADQLLASPITEGAQEYCQLHEDVIAGPTPYSQLGIEYEIEMLSMTLGPKLIDNIARVCGKDRVAKLSFLTNHIELDVGHTEFNRRQLESILNDHPGFGEPIGQAGKAALETYGSFLEDCLDAASQ